MSTNSKQATKKERMMASRRVASTIGVNRGVISLRTRIHSLNRMLRAVK